MSDNEQNQTQENGHGVYIRIYLDFGVREIQPVDVLVSIDVLKEGDDRFSYNHDKPDQTNAARVLAFVSVSCETARHAGHG